MCSIVLHLVIAYLWIVIAKPIEDLPESNRPQSIPYNASTVVVHNHYHIVKSASNSDLTPASNLDESRSADYDDDEVPRKPVKETSTRHKKRICEPSK